MNATITLTVMAGFDGGRIVYETVPSDEYGTHDSRLVFGGNVEETSKYVAKRIAEMSEAGAQSPQQIAAPVKIKVRRKPGPVVDPLDALDALEMAEDVA